MASPNISFDTIPGSIRKPGKYFEFNTRTAVSALPTNLQRVLILGQMTSDALAKPLEVHSVFSDESAAQLFGRGSWAHLMAKAAIEANSYLQLDVIGVPDDVAGIAASCQVPITGTATGSGVISLFIGHERINVAVYNADTAATIAAQLATLINQHPVLPVSANTQNNTLVITAKNKGAAGNDIYIHITGSVKGITATATKMTGGEIDPDIKNALTAVFNGGHNIIVCPYSTTETLSVLRDHVEAVSGALEQRAAIVAGAWTKSLATGTTLATHVNCGRITLAWYRGSVTPPALIAAGYAAVIAGEEDPARPLNTIAIKGLDVVDINQRISRAEQENALYNGLTPLEVGAGNRVRIVRAISAYMTNDAGAPDVSLLDLTTIRTLDYVRKACRERIELRFPRDKLSERTPPKVRSELIDVLYKLEELEIIEKVNANLTKLIIERDLQDANRLNAVIPADVVNGLHVFAGRVDLYL